MTSPAPSDDSTVDGSAPDLAQCASFALTGHYLGGARPEVSEPGQLLAVLRDHGWTPQRLAALRDQRHHDGQGWPMALPIGVPAPGGFARFHAWVSEVVVALNLDSRDAGVRDASQPLDAETRRLMADLPPHYGSAG